MKPMAPALAKLRRAVAVLRCEDGQAATEYSLFTGFVIFGAALGLGGFLPAMFAAYQHYVHGYWLVLSLPIP
jgi:Flp pilus assembly pilin Flp